ncbi:MAG: MFS transporter [Anaerolineales bacterium]|uniref:MFS transporter n=1 Tax=Candidatus Villigracilis vicinus TaxID=3140679 RepID=UPI003136F0FF|nr:MFS transporter [Anaerolineales bacterium]MBK7449171.1 MFS transporter [Anaerolineales bacterium]
MEKPIERPSLINTYTRSFEPLKIRNLRIYLGGQAVSLLGTWMQATAQSWVVWELTHSESSLGIVVMLNSLPLFLLAPWAGGFADRYNRRVILLVTQAIAMLLAFTMAFLVQTNLVQIWHIYTFSFILGTIAALDFPAQQAFIGDLSGMKQIRQAVTLNIMGLQVARMLGPAAAGILLKVVGSAAAFWINGASFMVVLLSIFMVKSHQQEINKRDSGRGQFREVLDYVRSQPRMVDLLIFASLVTFFGLSIMNILPAVADHVLKGDSQTFGLLMGSSGAGALISTLFLLPLSQTAKRIGRIVGGAAIWMGTFYLLLSRSTFLPLSMVSIFLVSLGAPLVLTTGLGVMQLMAPGDMRARIISLFTMVSFGLQPLSSLFIGYTAEVLGAETVIMINAICLALGATLMLILRKGLLQWELKPLVEPILSSHEKNASH